MALVSTGFQLEVSLLDSGNDVTRKTYQLRGADFAAATANAATMIGALSAASDAKLIGYRVAEVFAEDAIAAFADDKVRNSNQAVITVTIANNPLKKGTIVVPAPKNALFTSVSGEGSDVIQANAALVTGLVGQFKATGSVFISDGEDVDDVPNIRGVRRTVYRRLA